MYILKWEHASYIPALQDMFLLVKEWNVIKNLDSCKVYLIVIPVKLSWNKRLSFSRVNRATGSFTSFLMRKGFQ